MVKSLIIIILLSISQFVNPLLSLNFPKKSYMNYTSEIIFHELPGAPWLLRDTGFCGYSELMCELEKIKIKVSTSYLDLSSLVNNTNINSILVLPPFKFHQYYSFELNALTKWISKGGSLLIFSEHENVYKCSSWLQNHLLCHTGLSISEPILLKNQSPWFELPLIWDNKKSDSIQKKVEFYAVSSINTKHSNKHVPFIYDPVDPDTVIACGTKFNCGSIAILGDSENIFNGNEYFGIKKVFNKEFFTKIIMWLKKNKNLKKLPHNSKISSKQNFSSGFKIKKNRKKIWFYNKNHSLRTDFSFDGLYRFLKKISLNFNLIISTHPPDDFDFAIMAVPLKPIPDKISKLLHNKKLILLGDAYTKIDKFTVNGRLLAQLGFSDTNNYPLNKISRQRGFFFLSSTLYNLNDNCSGYYSNPSALLFSMDKKETSTIFLKKPGLLICPPKSTILIKGTSSGFASNVSYGLDERVPFNNKINKLFYDPRDVKIENVGIVEYKKSLKIDTRKFGSINVLKPFIIAAFTKNTLCIADSTLITNQMFRYKSSRKLIDEIINWIKFSSSES